MTIIENLNALTLDLEGVRTCTGFNRDALGRRSQAEQPSQFHL
jgi:hypothetical protein